MLGWGNEIGELRLELHKLETRVRELAIVVEEQSRAEFLTPMNEFNRGKLIPTLNAKINALARHLGVNFDTKPSEPAEVIVLKKGKPNGK